MEDVQHRPPSRPPVFTLIPCPGEIYVSQHKGHTKSQQLLYHRGVISSQLNSYLKLTILATASIPRLKE